MPHTRIDVFCDENGDIPLLNWLEEQEPKVTDKCLGLILDLEANGYELRRPRADILRDGIYELRAKVRRVNYRILYFFNGPNVVVLSHGLTKKSSVPDKDINLAIKRKKLVKEKPEKHIKVFET